MATCATCYATVESRSAFCPSCGDSVSHSNEANTFVFEQKNQSGSFFGGLFDLSFNNLILLKMLKVFYVLGLCGIILFGLVFCVTSLMRGGTTAIFGLLVVPVITLFWIIYFRIFIEVFAVIFKMNENLQKIAVQLSKN